MSGGLDTRRTFDLMEIGSGEPDIRKTTSGDSEEPDTRKTFE